MNLRRPTEDDAPAVTALIAPFDSHFLGEPEGVDAQNPTGATRVYERAAMEVARSAVVFEKALDG